MKEFREKVSQPTDLDRFNVSLRPPQSLRKQLIFHFGIEAAQFLYAQNALLPFAKHEKIKNTRKCG